MCFLKNFMLEGGIFEGCLEGTRLHNMKNRGSHGWISLCTLHLICSRQVLSKHDFRNNSLDCLYKDFYSVADVIIHRIECLMPLVFKYPSI